MIVKIIGILLVLIHIGLAVWALGGTLEWLQIEVPWKPYSNPEFPRWVLFIHWSSVLIASFGFLYGYFSHWNYTPYFMIFAYGYMAVVCAIETFGYMTSETKYIAMVAEYIAYSVILILLFQPVFRQEYFME